KRYSFKHSDIQFQGPKPAFTHSRAVPDYGKPQSSLNMPFWEREVAEKSLPNHGIYHQQSARFLMRRYGTVGTVHRAEPGLPRRGRAREPRRALEPARTRHWRARHRQGADRRASASPFVPLGRAADYHELRRAARKPDRG